MTESARKLGLSFAIDTNKINSRQSLPNMNRLEQWHKAGLIEILMPETAYKEALQGADSRRWLKARARIFSINTFQSHEEVELRRRVLSILAAGSGPSRQTVNDSEIVANAHKYGCILITADGSSRTQPGGILGHRSELAEIGIRVASDSEAVELVLRRISRRDTAEINLARVEGRDPAAWVGQDT